jgi:hypothetical protein
LGQYLEGAAADWLSVLRNEKLESYTLDEEGVQTTDWHELSWEELKRMFEKEFGEEKEKEIFTRNQASGETGMTFFYKMIKLHQRSQLNLDEGQLATLIISHMTDLYKDKLVGKKFTSLEKLKDVIKLQDERRSRDLAAKNKDKKRTTTVANLMEEAEEHLSKKEKYDAHSISALKSEFESQISSLQNQIQQQSGPTGPSPQSGNKPWGQSDTTGFRGRGGFRGASRGTRGNFRGPRFRQFGQPQGTRSSSDSGGNIRTCYHCNKVGHVWRDCYSYLAQLGKESLQKPALAIAAPTASTPGNANRQ